MSIPLVQNNEKDSINTSIIAIKRNIERINMLLGLVDNDSPDLSGFATKQELEDAITQVETDLAPVDEVTVGNMQSVTSNAVAKILVPSSTTIIESTNRRSVTLTSGRTDWWGMSNYPPPSVPSGKRLVRTFARCSNVNTATSICNYANNKTGVLTTCDESGTYDIWLCIEVADL